MSENFFVLFETAERHIKGAERLFQGECFGGDVAAVQGLLFPAVNELRYAGFHFAKSVSTTDADEKAVELEKAVRHCQRASLDANDAQLQFLLGECRQFKNDYRMICIGGVVNEYLGDCTELNRINRSLNTTERSEISLEDLECWRNLLVAIVERWTMAREELNKIVDDIRREHSYRLLQIFIGVLAIVASIVCAVFWQ
ncbi:MAG: hypothetical protein ACRC46_12345 [Thermoguttaceae bacterium]